MPSGPPPQIKPKSLSDYLAVMTKSVFQSGISWKVVNTKWPGIVEAFKGFDVDTVAGFDERDIEELSQDVRVIRNVRKLEAIVSNARKMLELDKKPGGFRKYLRSHGDFDATIQAIRKDFKFMGPSGIYVFLYIVGEPVIPHEEFEAKYRSK